MLPTHLKRLIGDCINGDYEDPAVRRHIKLQCIPLLSQHRREVLSGSYKGRHGRPAGFICKMLENSRFIRRTLGHAHSCLIAFETSSNVLSFESAAQRRRVNLAASA
jgi:hypothetical protein